MEFNDLLKIKRKEKGYTQKEMAERLGITRGGYNNYEVGQSTPSYKTLVKIANIFNVTTDYLLGNTHENNDLSADLDPINKKIYTLYESHNKDLYRSLRGILEYIPKAEEKDLEIIGACLAANSKDLNSSKYIMTFINNKMNGDDNRKKILLNYLYFKWKTLAKQDENDWQWILEYGNPKIYNTDENSIDNNQ